MAQVKTPACQAETQEMQVLFLGQEDLWEESSKLPRILPENLWTEDPGKP